MQIVCFVPEYTELLLFPHRLAQMTTYKIIVSNEYKKYTSPLHLLLNKNPLLKKILMLKIENNGRDAY